MNRIIYVGSITAGVLLLILAVPELWGLSLAVCWVAISTYVHTHCFNTVEKPGIRCPLTIDRVVLVTVIGLTLYASVAERFAPSSKLKSVEVIVGIDVDVIIFLIWLALFMLAAVELDGMICVFGGWLDKLPHLEPEKKKEARMSSCHWLIVLFTSMAVVSLFSKSSFLYPFNDWPDANIFFTMGKSMLKGKILYKDIYDQKGPLIFMLHAVAALISYKTFHGVYVFEIIACIMFLTFSAKICLLFMDSEYVKALIPVVGVMTYSSVAFCHGDSAEEFFLPLIAHSLYTGIKICISQKVELKDVFWTGVFTGIVLWTKYTVLGFYIGWVLVFFVFFLMQKEYGILLKSIVSYINGVLCITVPILLYFIKWNALKDLFESYFYNNIVLYKRVSEEACLRTGWFYNVMRGIREALYNNWACGIVILMCVILLGMYKNQLFKMFVCTTLIFSCIFVFKGDVSWNYYSLVFCAYLGIGLAFSLSVIDSVRKKEKKVYISIPKEMIIIGICLAIGVMVSSNSYLLFHSKGEMPQYKFAKIIEEKENPTLQNYGFMDGGFFTVSGIVPEMKYFCGLNIKLEEIKDTQEKYLREQKADFVVTCDEELENNNYSLVEEASHYLEGQIRNYRLYARKRQGI